MSEDEDLEAARLGVIEAPAKAAGLTEMYNFLILDAKAYLLKKKYLMWDLERSCLPQIGLSLGQADMRTSNIKHDRTDSTPLAETKRGNRRCNQI